MRSSDCWNAATEYSVATMRAPFRPHCLRSAGSRSRRARALTSTAILLGRRDEKAVVAVANQVESAAAGDADDRLRECHRFEEDEAESFAGTGKREDVALCVTGGDLWAGKIFEEISRNCATFASAAIFFKRGKSSPLPTMASESIGIFSAKSGDGADQLVGAFVFFVRGPAADGEDHRATATGNSGGNGRDEGSAASARKPGSRGQGSAVDFFGRTFCI